MAKYKFKGYTISCCGYHQPDHCVWWEAVDDSGFACFHGTTLREVEFRIIDSEWEDKLKAKDREVAELRELLKTILPYAEAGYCTRKKTHGCTGCPLSSIVAGEKYAEPICRIFKWRKAQKGEINGK